MKSLEYLKLQELSDLGKISIMKLGGLLLFIYLVHFYRKKVNITGRHYQAIKYRYLLDHIF